MMNHSEMDHSGMDHGSMDHGSMDHSGSGLGCDMDMMMMQMWFTTDVKCTILFEQWKTTSVGSMIGSCVGILAMAILYEGLKYFRERLHRRSYVAQKLIRPRRLLVVCRACAAVRTLSRRC